MNASKLIVQKLGSLQILMSDIIQKSFIDLNDFLSISYACLQSSTMQVFGLMCKHNNRNIKLDSTPQYTIFWVEHASNGLGDNVI